MNVHATYESPIGTLTLQANENGLQGTWFKTQTTRPKEPSAESGTYPILLQAIEELDEYFNGQRTSFDVPLAAQGTEFQKQVWQALTAIPSGETCSYQDLANAINYPKAVRAVGLANAKNPISIIVPCHRVIGKNGKLTGYAGGIERKEWLLKHEGALPNSLF